jgi:hypothetical protein
MCDYPNRWRNGRFWRKLFNIGRLQIPAASPNPMRQWSSEQMDQCEQGRAHPNV